MIHEVIQLNEDGSARLTTYFHTVVPEIDRSYRPLILIAPGGAYEYTSAREADPVAVEFYRMGYHVAVLDYSVGMQARNMQPMAEGFAAIRLFRSHAREWGILGDHIAVCGFSAGGHLAASLGVMWNEATLAPAKEIAVSEALMQSLSIPQEKMREETEQTAALEVGGEAAPNAAYRPNLMILCYPVISSGVSAHRDSFYNLSGSHEDDAATAFFSLEKRVTKDTPPAFLWHTQDDGCVPPQNSLLMATALQEKGVSYELHIFRAGWHGLSVCSEETHSPNAHCANWLPLCREWLGECWNDLK